jgi:predicted acyltransferase
MVRLVKANTHPESADASGQEPENSGVTRDLEIDRFRGALVILMVIGDYLSGVEFVPSFLKHAPDIGFTLADTVAPAFVFVIGLNFGPSFRRQAQKGWVAAYRHVMMRYLALTGMGAIIAAATTMVGQPGDWGVLEAIGVAGLISLLFIRLPVWARFLIGTLMLGAYQYVVDTAMLETVVNSVHGGLFGAVSWGALLVLSTAVADVWRRGPIPFLICLIVLISAAGMCAVFVPVSKHRVSLSYIVITLAMSALVFLIIKSFAGAGAGAGAGRPGILCWWGQNALALYFLHLVVLAFFVTPPVAWWYAQAPAWLAAIQLTAILAFMSMIARWIDIRRHN